MHRRTTSLSVLAVIALLAASLAAGAGAADRVYWSNISAPNSIGFANLDGSGGGGTLGGTAATPAAVSGLAIDTARNRLYSGTQSTIAFADLDGGGWGELNVGAAPVSGAKSVAFDPTTGTLYWSNSSPASIAFARVDGSGGGTLNTGLATLSSPIGVVVDPAGGRLYWSDAGSKKIAFANLDGSGGNFVNTGAATIDNPQGVVLDLAAGLLYWTNVYGQKISFARLDEGGGGDLPTTGATVSNPSGLAIDPVTKRIYWANVVGGKISSAKLDGTGGGADLPTTGATTSNPAFPVILKSPVATAAPQIASAGPSLTCSQGAYAADLVASFLYRGPGTFAYRWSRDGTAIPGATASTYTLPTELPSAGAGAYRCTVTASNPAGSVTQASTPLTVLPPPALSGLTIRPRAFRATGKSAGANVSFVLSEAAAVTFKVQRRLPGRTAKNGACVKPGPANLARKKCSRLLGVRGELVRTGVAGANSFRFKGRLQGKKLSPGAYLLLATPALGGKSGSPSGAGFKIKPAPAAKP